MKTIIVVDDHELFRAGLRFVIERWEDFRLLGEASDGEEAIELARRVQPDIVLMDIAMPRMDGIEAVRRIKAELSAIQVVMLTVSESEEDLLRALKHGATGYVLKSVKSAELRRMLSGILDGEAPLSSRMAAKIIQEFKQGTDREATADLEESPLTPRETQVLELVAAGLSNPEVASRLVISENTVKKHLHNILEKLHLTNRVEAAVFAVRQGMIGD